MSTLKTTGPGDHEPTIMGMPEEILSKIFILCSGPDWRPNPKGFNSHEAPLLLTKVCRHWRNVSISTQRLWTVLPSLGKVRILPGSGTDKLFQMYLAYSGNAPLSILIFIQATKQNDDTIALLSPHLHRVGRLLIIFSPSGAPGHLLDRLFAGHQGDFALLTHLRLVSSSSVQFHPQVSLPWSQIKYYHHSLRDINEISDTLVLCTALETLDLCAERSYETKSYDARASVFLPRLRRMRLSDPNGTSDQFLNSLRAPHLEVIQIYHASRTSPIPSALIACVARSHCTELTSLELLCSHISADELLKLSSLTPRLRELNIRLTPDAFRALRLSFIGNHIFPRLVRLTVRDVMVPDWELIGVCRSRFSPSPNGIEGEPQAEPLQYCRIYLRGELEVARRLQDVAESFQDDTGFRNTMHRVKRLLSNTVRTSPDIPLEVPPENVHHLENCFDFLEKHKINHALLLERHNSKHILGQISMESPGNNAVPPHSRMRASALLAKWKPLMEEYNARDARWVLGRSGYNAYSLVYHPTIKPEGHFASKFLGPLVGGEYQY